jgi:hypothetical protein
MTSKTLRPEDELEIRNRTSRSCITTDNADADAFMACWVPAEQFGLLVLEVAQEPRLVATGRDDTSVVVRTPAGWRFKPRKPHVDPGYFVLVEQWKKASRAGAR